MLMCMCSFFTATGTGGDSGAAAPPPRVPGDRVGLPPPTVHRDGGIGAHDAACEHARARQRAIDLRAGGSPPPSPLYLAPI